jgi:hypothetical protein
MPLGKAAGFPHELLCANDNVNCYVGYFMARMRVCSSTVLWILLFTLLHLSTLA